MSEILRGPAYRIETERLVLRCFEPRDAAALKAAIDRSLDHIRPWIPWAGDEPQSLDRKVELLRQYRGKFDLGQDRIYAIFDRGESTFLGSAGLHDRVGEGARELGYWIAVDHVRRGYATEACAALVRTGFEVDLLQRIELHCEPENAPSAGVARKLGFRHDGTLRARLPRRDGRAADCMVWSMLSEEYPVSPCAPARSRAFDACGRSILEAVSAGPGGAASPESPAKSRSAFR